MKRIITILLLITIFAYGCEDVTGIDETPNTHCKEVYDVHIKLWDSLYATGNVSNANMRHILNQVKLEYQQCMEGN